MVSLKVPSSRVAMWLDSIGSRLVVKVSPELIALGVIKANQAEAE